MHRLLEAWRGRAARLRPSSRLLWRKASAKELRQLQHRRRLLAANQLRLLLDKDRQLPLCLRLGWVLEICRQPFLLSAAQGLLPLGGDLLEDSSFSWLALRQLRLQHEPIRAPLLMALRLLGRLEHCRQPLQVSGLKHGPCALLGGRLLLRHGQAGGCMLPQGVRRQQPVGQALQPPWRACAWCRLPLPLQHAPVAPIAMGAQPGVNCPAHQGTDSAYWLQATVQDANMCGML